MNKITRLSAVFSMAVLLAASAGSAWAMSAASTLITNTADLAYNDGTGVKHAPATVQVKVALVKAAVTIIPVSTTYSTQYTAANTVLNNDYTVTANANGVDSYTITPNIGVTNNTSGQSVSVLVSPAITLGATVTTSGSPDATHIWVPADATGTDTVNGISAANGPMTVVIGGVAVPVVSVTNPGGSGVAKITVGPGLAAAPGAGVGVYQQKTVTIQVLSGTVQVAGNSITINSYATITASASGPSANTIGSQTLNTYNTGTATLAKYVRNATSGVNGTNGNSTGVNPKTFNIAGQGALPYYLGGVTAAPGDTLEYVLQAHNSGTGSVSGVVLTDTIPAAYVSPQVSAYSSNLVDYINDAGVETTIASGTAYSVPPTLTVNVGTIGAGLDATIAYKVILQNN